MLQVRTRQELKEVLMDPKGEGVKEPYFVIRGEGGQNVTIVTPGKNGVEFNKTYGHFNKFQWVEIYHVVYGQGVVVLQRNDDSGETKEFKVVGVKSGSTVEIPSGFGHCLVNVGRTYLVVIDNSPNDPKAHDFEPVKQKRGFTYYVIDRKGEIGFEANPNYKIHPQIATL